MKKCSKCKRHKDESGFSFDNYRSDGLSNYCRVCKSEYKKLYTFRKVNGFPTKEKKKKVIIERKTFTCRGCGKQIQNRGNSSDFCVYCLPKPFCSISYCKFCGIVLSGKNRMICDNCKHLDVRRRKDNVRDLCSRLKESFRFNGCVVCGYKECLQALEFHHIGGKKDRVISRIKSVSILKSEILRNPVVVLCANHHREVHNKLINDADLVKFRLKLGNHQLILFPMVKRDKN